MAGVAVTVGGNFAKLDELDSKVKSTVRKIKTGFQERIGHRMFDGLRNAARRIPGAINDAIAAASDLNEVVTKTGEVFQSSAQDMLDWSENSATAFGQSGAAALGAAADYGNLFRAMDIAPEKAAAMSQRMVELAADLASFNNTSVEEAVVAIGAALRGEAEPIRRYGVLLNEATLKAEAFTQGLSDGKSTLDPTTKALAAYNLILSKTTTAQGDFARTSDGAANSARIIKAQIADASAEFGSAFLPAVEDVAAKLKTVDWTGMAQGLASVLKAAISLAPALIAIGTTMAAVKIATFITALVAKTAAMYAAATAAKAESAALAQNAGATAAKTAADRAATAASRGHARAAAALGGVLVIAAIGAQLMANHANKLAAENSAMAASFDLGNAALKKFNAETLRGEVTSRDDIAAKLAELETEKQEIRDATEAQTRDMDGDLAARVNAETEMTIKLLDQQARRLKATSDAQLAANQAKAEAVAAEARHAEAIRNAAENFEKAKKSFDDALASREKAKFDDSGMEEKIASLNAAEAKIREGFNFAIKTNLGDATGTELAEVFSKNPDRPGADKDLEAAAELIEIETKRAALRKDLAEKQAKEKSERAALVESYDEELAMLNFEIEGNDVKLAQLRREAAIREKIAELTKAGVGEKETTRLESALVDAQGKTEEKERRRPGLEAAATAGASARQSIGGKEAELGNRIAELIKNGLSESEAEKTANLENLTQRNDDLTARRESARDNQAIVTGGQGRIGGGGGVYVAGLDYQRQIAEINREQLTVSKQIAESLGNNRMFD